MVLGIAGGSASGKTTLLNRVVCALEAMGRSVEAVSLDRFYWREPGVGPMVTLSDGTVWPDRNRPDAVDLDSATAAIDGSTADVVLVEGLFTLAIPTLRERLDSSVYLHLDADLRALRRMLRDMKGGRTSTDPEFIARYYIECARVGHAEFVEPSRAYADAVFDGDDEGMAGAVAFLARRA